MNKTDSSNRKIAKNTVFLYTRMLLLLAISLYTSRVVLQTLGVDNYGTYNVVCGTVVLFSFVSMALATGTQRHISFELGKKGGNVPKIFSACIHVHTFIAVLVFILSETAGLWFLNTQMNFPEGSMTAVNIIYQLSILSCCIGIIQTPYTSALIAYERMSFYAYYGIVEATLKLLVVYALITYSGDKLILYGSLQFAVVLIMLLSITTYCHKTIPGVKYVSINDKSIYKYLLSFSGWTLFGSIAVLLETQGLNMLINIFYGVTINAAVGVSNQIKSYLNQFVAGFQQALNPQLVMSQSSGDSERQQDLIYKSSKFSFFIFYCLSLPVIVNLDSLLQIWLGKVPPFTREIAILVTAAQIIDCVSSPLYTTIFAVGNIKVYQLMVALFRTCSILVGLAICHIGMAPYMIYIVPCFVALALLIYRMVYVNRNTGLSLRGYCEGVILPILSVLLITLIPCITYRSLVPSHSQFFVIFIETVAVGLFNLAVIYLCGLTPSERKMMTSLITNKLKR